MKITIETEEKAEISSQTTAAAKVVDQMDGGTSPAILEETQTQETILAPSVETTEPVDAGQPPLWLVEAIESSAPSKAASSQEIMDAGSGPSK